MVAGNCPGAEGAAQVVERLGYVQIDTIAVVERAHHHTLWRGNPITPLRCWTICKRARAARVRVLAHAAAYVPMRDYRFICANALLAEREHVWLASTARWWKACWAHPRRGGAGRGGFRGPRRWVRRAGELEAPQQALERLFATAI
jgi:uncharacterized protein YcaQ